MHFQSPGRARSMRATSGQRRPGLHNSDPRVEAPMQTYPVASGLYDPRFEHDSCGVSFVANMRGVASNELVRTGLSALCNLEHRGATGAEADTGDGAGILVQIPDRLLRAVVEFDLPPVGGYAVGIAFLPVDDNLRHKAEDMIETIIGDCGLTV